MFTREAHVIIDRTKDVATSWGTNQLSLNAIVTSMVMDHRSARLLAEGLETEQGELRRLFPAPEILQQCQGKLTLTQEVRDMLGLAQEFVKQVPSPSHPALIALPHLACAVAQSLPASQLPGGRPPSREQTPLPLRIASRYNPSQHRDKSVRKKGRSAWGHAFM